MLIKKTCFEVNSILSSWCCLCSYCNLCFTVMASYAFWYCLKWCH